MVRKIQNFAGQNILLWAFLMGCISISVLFIVGMVINNNGNNYEDAKPLLEFVKMIFYFIVLNLFFMLFSLTKKISTLFRIADTILFFITFFIIYMLSSDNMEYLNQKINFIPVIEWTDNGYEPPEEEVSSVFCWFIFMCLSFINVVFINLVPVKIKINYAK